MPQRLRVPGKVCVPELLWLRVLPLLRWPWPQRGWEIFLPRALQPWAVVQFF